MQALNQVLTTLSSVFRTLAANEFLVKGLAAVAVAIVMLGIMGVGIAEGHVAAKAMESVGRQPELVGKIRATMIIGQIMIETSAIYQLIVAIMLVTKI